METIKEENFAEYEWQWCLVGNIVKEHKYGENHELRYGNKQFRPNTKVFVNLVYGGMGHESVLVIGIPRYSKRYIEIVIARKYIENFRLQKVFKPAVLKRMNQSDWNWWGNTNSCFIWLIFLYNTNLRRPTFSWLPDKFISRLTADTFPLRFAASIAIFKSELS